MFWGLGIEHETNYFSGTTLLPGRAVLKLWQPGVNLYPGEPGVMEMLRHFKTLINPKHQYPCLIRWDDIYAFTQAIDPKSTAMPEKLTAALKKGQFDRKELDKLVEVDSSNIGLYPEFVTSKFKNATVGGCVAELQHKERLFAQVTHLLYDTSLKQCRYGAWPLIITKSTDGDDAKDKHVAEVAAAKKGAKPKAVVLCQDYNGSYHINITLPVAEKTKFYDAHLAAMKMLQWMEPLFVAAWGQPSVFSFGDSWRYVEGSERMISNDHSRMGTRSLSMQSPNDHSRMGTAKQLLGTMAERGAAPARVVKKKVQRYVDREADAPVTIPVYLRNTERVVNTVPAATYGADFRRGQKEPFGFEFRILDHFPTDHLPDIMHVLLLVCDQSAGVDPRTIPDPQANSDWNEVARTVMLEGWNAQVTAPQILAFTQALNLDIRGQMPKTAWDLFRLLVKMLWARNGSGRGAYTRHMVEPEQRNKKPHITNLNKAAFDAYASLFIAGKPALARRPDFEDKADAKALKAPKQDKLLL